MKNKACNYLFTLVSLFALFGCSERLPDHINGDLQLKIEVDGIAGVAEVAAGAIPRSATNLLEPALSSTPSAPAKSDGFTAEFSTAQVEIESPLDAGEFDAQSLGNTPRRNTISRATTPMQSGYTYRILVYNKSTGVLWRTIQATSGTPVTLDAERGVTYTWYAYSFNNTETLPEPQNLSNPNIETSISKDFLYATGETVIPPTGEALSYNVGIEFQHKVAQVHIKMDATVLARYATINNLNVSFANPNYIKKGVFDIRGNQMNQMEVVPTETIFNAASSTSIWEAIYYTADPAAVSSYEIIVNDLPVVFSGVNPSMANRNLATYFGAANRPRFTSTFASPAAGQRLTTNARLNYQPAPLRILHFSNTNSNGYSMQRGPSWDFLNSKVNFGDLPESVVKIGSYGTAEGEGAWIGGRLADNTNVNFESSSSAGEGRVINRLAQTNTTNRPDILIIGYDVGNISVALGQALNNYLNDKGVIVMLLQGGTNNNTRTFFNNLFGVANIDFNTLGSAAGAMYPIEGTDSNDPILNGPFGDVRTRHWGDDAGPSTLALTNVPESQVTIYSRGNAINRAAATGSSVTMFKHNTKSLFFVGDGGFVAYNSSANTTRFPFRYDETTKLPFPKAFGDRYRVGGVDIYTAGSLDAYNSIVIANVMAWAVKKAELEGIRVWKYAGPPTP